MLSITTKLGRVSSKLGMYKLDDYSKQYLYVPYFFICAVINRMPVQIGFDI